MRNTRSTAHGTFHCLTVGILLTSHMQIPMAKIKVQNTEVTVITYNDKDYISLTDMVRNVENGPALIEKWLRNRCV